jgi:hypothetical protein
MSIFKNPFDPNNELIIQKIKIWIVKKYKLIPETANISVNEVGCGDSNCPCVKTNISFGKNQKIIISKPLVFIRQWDI